MYACSKNVYINLKTQNILNLLILCDTKIKFCKCQKCKMNSCLREYKESRKMAQLRIKILFIFGHTQDALLIEK